MHPANHAEIEKVSSPLMTWLLIANIYSWHTNGLLNIQIICSAHTATFAIFQKERKLCAIQPNRKCNLPPKKLYSQKSCLINKNIFLLTSPASGIACVQASTVSRTFVSFVAEFLFVGGMLKCVGIAERQSVSVIIRE